MGSCSDKGNRGHRGKGGREGPPGPPGICECRSSTIPWEEREITLSSGQETDLPAILSVRAGTLNALFVRLSDPLPFDLLVTLVIGGRLSELFVTIPRGEKRGTIVRPSITEEAVLLRPHLEAGRFGHLSVSATFKICVSVRLD